MSRQMDFGKWIALVFLFAAAFLLQCSKNPVSEENSDTPEPITVEKKLIQSENRFGLKLFREINKISEDKDVFISPLSVSMALGMTLNGADGTTRDSMEKTLEFQDLTCDEINQCYRNLIDGLTQADPKVELNIANAIWCRLGLVPRQQFVDVNSVYFDSRVSGLNFTDPGAADTINAWVYENTNGKIERVFDPPPLSPDLVMILANAIYFKGSWTYEFDENLTMDDIFYLSDGGTKTCKMMGQRSYYPYYENDDFQAVDLPYGDGDFSMTVFLPRKGLEVDDFVAGIDQESYDGWLGCLESDSGDIYLPKFKLKYDTKLNNALKSLGMGIAFSPSDADFSEMYEQIKVWIDFVLHKTFIQVDEEGTEAAAVTITGMTTSAEPPVPSGFVMRVDRPFAFVIREHNTGAILFIGKIVNPVFE